MAIDLKVLQQYRSNFPQISEFPELIPAQEPYLLLAPFRLDFGLISRDDILTHNVYLENIGGGILEVNEILFEEDWMQHRVDIQGYERRNIQLKEIDKPIKLQVNFDTSKLTGGKYKGRIAFLTNSPNNRVELPLSFKVLTEGPDVKIRLKEGKEGVLLNEGKIDFGNIALYQEKDTQTKVLIIENTGYEVVKGRIKIEDCNWLTIDNKYWVKEKNISKLLQFGKKRKCEIQRRGDSVEIKITTVNSNLKKGSHNRGQIVLMTNSAVPSKQEIIIDVQARGIVEEPILQVSKKELDFGKIYCGENKTETLKLFNIGKGVLRGEAVLRLNSFDYTLMKREFDILGDEESVDSPGIDLAIPIPTQNLPFSKLEGNVVISSNSYLKEREFIEIPVKLEVVGMITSPEKIEFEAISYGERKEVEVMVKRSDDLRTRPDISIPSEYQEWIEVTKSNHQGFKLTFKVEKLTKKRRFEGRIKIADKNISSLTCEIPFSYKVVFSKIKIEMPSSLNLAFEEIGSLSLKIKNEGSAS